METKKKEQNTKAEAETFAATVKGMNRDDQLMLNGFLLGLGAAKSATPPARTGRLKAPEEEAP